MDLTFINLVWRSFQMFVGNPVLPEVARDNYDNAPMDLVSLHLFLS